MILLIYRYQDLTKEYGDPTTYPESPNSISKIPSYEELATDRISHYMETWKVNDEISVTLEMKYILQIQGFELLFNMRYLYQQHEHVDKEVSLKKAENYYFVEQIFINKAITGSLNSRP